MTELLLIEQTKPDIEDDLDYVIAYQNHIVESVKANLLDRMRKMASIIDQEPPGSRKDMMVAKYEEIDADFEKYGRIGKELKNGNSNQTFP